MSAHEALALAAAALIVGIPTAVAAWLATLLSRKPDARDYADMDETVPRTDRADGDDGSAERRRGDG